MVKYSSASVMALAASVLMASSSTTTTTSAFVTPTVTTRQTKPLSMVTTAPATETATPPLSPLTIWGDRYEDIVAVQEEYRAAPAPEFAPTVTPGSVGVDPNDEAAQLAFFEENGMALKQKMQENAAVVFRDFSLMKTQEGFQQFYQAIGMNPCLDPLHSVSARPTVDGKKGSPVYEAVNKESRKNFFIGMHNEFVGTRAPRAAAFVCFKAAETGGEFLICDGRAMFRDLDSALLQKLYSRGIRYSVMELPFFDWIDSKLPAMLQQPVMNVLQTVASTAINAKVDFDVDLQWGVGGYDQVRMLQARAPSQPPILAHPVTGEPTWFCNVHSHSSKLRKDREAIYGAERFEDGASQINKSDMYYGDDGDLSDEELKHLDEITLKNVKYVKMSEGDVVLLDNYKCMHGRNVFDGTRKHGVAWFGGWQGEEEMTNQRETTAAAVEEDAKVPFFLSVKN